MVGESDNESIGQEVDYPTAACLYLRGTCVYSVVMSVHHWMESFYLFGSQQQPVLTLVMISPVLLLFRSCTTTPFHERTVFYLLLSCNLWKLWDLCLHGVQDMAGEDEHWGRIVVETESTDVCPANYNITTEIASEYGLIHSVPLVIAGSSVPPMIWTKHIELCISNDQFLARKLFSKSMLY